MYRKLILCAAFITTASTAASAQLVTTGNKPLSFGAAAGAAIPISDLSDFNNTGYNGTLILGINTPALPMSFRIEGAYNNFGDKGDNGDVHSTSLTGNVVFEFPSGSALRPYIIGGVGLYNTAASNGAGFSSGSSNDFGFNVGGGFTIPLGGFNSFVEARYHRIATSGVSTQFIPILFGVMF
jgi:hypothetical protein